ncbi:hypothetical protein AJ78_08736 [Emergomyces pasteurianus Ep9510]|uniref:AAA+ ATPase domain-containing protein n=1 Tax=Emergomyces pasteurianus Ep9510 TaxID=1447872 RepID=A0A1J9Q1J4_9EURO|nr:hypothetical protein AJ78_08736 [Emergomyces pasteurianus Ep9510]
MAASSAIALDSLFEAYIPGFSIASKVFATVFRVDLSHHLQYLIGTSAVFIAAKYAFEAIASIVWCYFASTVNIHMDDEVYSYVVYWLSRQKFSNNTPNFTVTSRVALDISHCYDSDSEDDEGYDSDMESDEDFDTYWKRTNRRGKAKRLNYAPAQGNHYFRYSGRFIKLDRSKQRLNSWSSMDHVAISCLGRDTAFLKTLLDEAQQAFIRRDGDKTIIYRAARRSDNVDVTWTRCMARHPRPMSTVVLDRSQKEDFMNDVKDYLHPFSKRWYSNRGIPYRRGYLFSGPPGCGKTSLCFAAAGELGLKIYIVDLNSHSLTEERLASLFSSLPSRCMVLLEDIDTAGLITNQRNADTNDTPAPASTTSIPESSEDGGKPRQVSPDDQPRPGVSLSGLLNTIDGVASSEGRILIMTTNHAENLDSALLRPGRVDMTINFDYASTNTLQDLYRAIYTKLDGDIKYSANKSSRTGSANKPSTQAQTKHIFHKNNFSPEEIDSFASDFASRIPAGKYTPAEIQGYLLRHKHSPRDAVDGVEEWMEDFERESSKSDASGQAKRGT